VPIVSSPEPEPTETLNTQRHDENKKLIFPQNNESHIGSTTQLGTQTPRLDSTLIGSTTSRTLIPDVKTDEGEILVFSNAASTAAARRRRIQKLKPSMNLF